MASARSRARARAVAARMPLPYPVTLAAAGALAALCAFAQPAKAQLAPGSTPATSQDSTTAAMPSKAAPASFAALAKAKLPAVVTITAAGEATAGGPGGPGGPVIPGLPGGPGGPGGPGQGQPGAPPFNLPPGSPLEDFFNDFFGRGGPGGQGGPNGGPARPTPTRSLGSGFIIDKAGYIVTNNHVVENATEIEVTLNDDRTLKAKLVGTDPATDVALLKVEDGGDLPTLAFGDSDRIEVGDWVIAIGNPFGLGGTVTSGIISARARDIGAGNYDDFLQTDAAINSGNSGGPLIDMAGQVVGMNTAIFSRTGGSIGIGFAVPSTMVRSVVAELRDKGFVTRGYLGVTIQPVTPEIADALGIQPRTGALVSSISQDSPAARAGVQTGDIITGVEGQKVERPRDLSRRVADIDPGQSVRLTLLRDGQERTVTAQVGELPREREQVAANDQAPSQDGTLGLTLAPITPDVRQRLGLEEALQGAVVTNVVPNSAAAERGFRPGDVITRANRDQVKSPRDLANAVEQARKEGRDSVVVLRRTEDGSVFVPLPLKPQGAG